MRKTNPNFLKDFADLLDCLLKAKCLFVVVGAHAMATWGYVRATGDLDILVIPSPENAENVLKALKKFGAPLRSLSATDLAKEGTVYQLGLPPLRIDILTKIDGVNSSAAISSAKLSDVAGIQVPVLSLEHLILNKKTTARPKDKMDVKELSKIARGKNAKKK